eukprot:NODE_248_length_1088_cov_357.977107_g241_i0.p1 GENE.NODE_248_length_1088_cov_357.977107_g241_i0~~NODE_248_length_1088_cov_357.977107_g241_i0.p1  ORF type:complete len:251 (+),score=51.08 NODE_248_length_1088_cov_357.977107_g241_i0:110-754(+)
MQELKLAQLPSSPVKTKQKVMGSRNVQEQQSGLDSLDRHIKEYYLPQLLAHQHLILLGNPGVDRARKLETCTCNTSYCHRHCGYCSCQTQDEHIPQGSFVLNRLGFPLLHICHWIETNTKATGKQGRSSGKTCVRCKQHFRDPSRAMVHVMQTHVDDKMPFCVYKRQLHLIHHHQTHGYLCLHPSQHLLHVQLTSHLRMLQMLWMLPLLIPLLP